MMQELIYTSASSGLKPGSRGYCTVASSAGMSKPMSEKLESLSGYRHLFPPDSPRASLNPIALSHVRVRVGGHISHILSRVADAGLDYSGRSNKLAHHIVLDTSDLPVSGPAACLSSSNLTITTWEGPARVLPARQAPVVPDLKSTGRQSWQSLAGDMNWCDYLLSRLKTGTPVYVIYPLGVNVLPLLVEAQSLMPHDERWQMTFSTYFTRTPPGVDCLVRCVPEGSREAKAILQRHDRAKIDLTKPGKAPAQPSKAGNRIPEELASAKKAPIPIPTTTGSDECTADLNLSPPELPPTPAKHNTPSMPRLPVNRNDERRGWLPIVAGIAVCIIVCTLLLFKVLSPHDAQPETSKLESEVSRKVVTIDSTSKLNNDPQEVTASDAADLAQGADASIIGTAEQPREFNVATSEEAEQFVEPVPVSATLTLGSAHPKVLASEIVAAEIRPTNSPLWSVNQVEPNGSWEVMGRDIYNLEDELYLIADINEAKELELIPGPQQNPVLASYTVVLTLSDEREIFVYSPKTEIGRQRIAPIDPTTTFEKSIDDAVIPQSTSIECSATIDGNNASVTRSEEAFWIEVAPEFLFKLTLKQVDASSQYSQPRVMISLVPFLALPDADPLPYSKLSKQVEKSVEFKRAVEVAKALLESLEVITASEIPHEERSYAANRLISEVKDIVENDPTDCPTREITRYLASRKMMFGKIRNLATPANQPFGSKYDTKLSGPDVDNFEKMLENKIENWTKKVKPDLEKIADFFELRGLIQLQIQFTRTHACGGAPFMELTTEAIR